MSHPRRIEKLATFATLAAAFDSFHSACDHFLQADRDAFGKDATGTHLVYTSDGTPVGEETDDRTGQPTTTATRHGWTCAARHAATYTAAQTTAAALVLAALGQRPSARALAASAAINGLTHLVIDRRAPLKSIAKRFGKGPYMQHCTVVRTAGEEPADTGPGTAIYELDQAAHRAIGVAAAVVTALVATR